MFDPERQNRFTNSYKVVFPDFPSITFKPRHIRILQAVGKHDIVELYYPVIPDFFVRALSTGVPVSIEWETDKVKGTFVGYTNHVSYSNVQAIERGLTITCVGPSFMLKEQGSKVWKNKTASEIVVDIASKMKLTPIVTQHPIRFTQQSLAGKSYLQKLHDLSEKTGYAFQVIGTELHFHPLDKMLEQFRTSIPVLKFEGYSKYLYQVDISPTLDYFKPKFGDYIETLPFQRQDKNVEGIDPVTSKKYKSKVSPNKVGKKTRKKTKDALFQKMETKVVIESKAMAEARAEALAQQSRFSIPASGVSQGDPRIAPYRTIEVRGTGVNSDGFWVVTKAEHYIYRDGRYKTEFECVTDGVGEPTEESVLSSENSGSLITTVSFPGIGGTQIRSSGDNPAARLGTTRISSRIPVRNLKQDISALSNRGTPVTGMGTPAGQSTTTLSAATSMIKESDIGFTVAPRQWVGKPWPSGQSRCHSE